jgi:uncharacterized protein YdaU (DUF1376 family)
MSAPFMQLYVGDYLGDTRHLTTEQHGAYLLLLMAMWRAGGTLPNDDAKLARIVGLSPARWRRVSSDVIAFFDADGANITQKRLVAEIEKAKEKSHKRADAGRQGGKAKALKSNDPPVANAGELPAYARASSEPEPYREELPTVVLLDHDDDEQQQTASNPVGQGPPRRKPADIAAEWFPDIWQAYALKVGKGSAMKALVSAIKREPGLTKPRLLDAVAAYITGKPQDIEFCHLATWLNGSRWDDEWPHPAAGRDGRAGRLRGGDAVLAGMGRLTGRFADRMTPYETMVAGFAADLAERPDSEFGMRIRAEAARGA